MTIPRIPSLLIMLALGREATALQMGQLATESVRGQPLVARVTLYGMAPLSATDIRAEVLPAFGDSLAMLGVQARIEMNANGEQAIVITSSQPLDTDKLALRVRLLEGGQSALRHYDLIIPAAPARVTQTARTARPAAARRAARMPVARDNGANAAPMTTMADSYGPVRAGQSLWGILKETGLAGANSEQLMRDIVAANPHAFVAGDATRLRVGVTLRLPQGGTLAAAPARTPRAGNQAIDADTAARLERLATQFAAIRARYAAQKHAATQATSSPAKLDNQTPTVAPAEVPAKAAPANDAAPTSDNAQARSVTAAPQAAIKAPVPALKAAAPAQNEPSPSAVDTLAEYVDGKVLMGVGAALLAAALMLGGMRIARRLRARMADAGLRSADSEMVAEIARKAEKRVQLEDEVKRMIAGRRDGGDESASGALRPSDMLSGARTSLDDIENRIAHGQYDEAEALLEQTIVDTPNNHRAKLRLAEIYYLNERHEEFIDLADEIHRQHRSDIGDENWARLMRMGKVIAPDRPPFSGPVAVESGRRAQGANV